MTGKNIILTTKFCRGPAKTLKESIFEKTGQVVYVTTRPADLEKKNYKLILRYGNISKTSEDTEFNSREAIQFLANKLLFTSRALEYGFIAPELFNRHSYPIAEDFPILIRKELRGWGGRDIIVCRTMEEFEKHWTEDTLYHWCRYIQNNEEFRFHIGILNDGEPEILRVSRKVPRKKETRLRDIQIRHNGEYKYSRHLNPEQKHPALSAQVKALAHIMPGRLYSLDVGWIESTQQAVFFEANTASGMDSGSANNYVDFLIKVGVL